MKARRLVFPGAAPLCLRQMSTGILDHVYQMSTKKGAEPLCFKGSAFFHFLGVYQMSTKVIFLPENSLFFKI